MEILSEIIATKGFSKAIAVIDEASLHYHKLLTETYIITKGSLKTIVEGKEHLLKEGEVITIKPGTKHESFGSETWLEVYSMPGWYKEDHILC